MTDPLQDATCWGVTTGEAGMQSQVIGLVEAVGFPYELKTIQPKAPWRWLPGTWSAKLHVLGNMEPRHDSIRPPWPDLLITTGHRPVGVAIEVRRASRGRTFTVHLQNPQVNPKHFNMVTPPAHDNMRGGNVYPTIGAIHKLTQRQLDAAAEQFRERFARFQRPLVSVLIGGSSRAYRMTPQSMRTLAEHLKAMSQQHGAGVAITASRRTGEKNRRILQEVLADTDAWLWDGQGENPYFGMLALADYLVVTEDSASMLSEACFTGKPVYVAALSGGSGRFRRLHEALRQRGCTRPLSGSLAHWTYEPLVETPRIAAIVREKLADHLAKG